MLAKNALFMEYTAILGKITILQRSRNMENLIYNKKLSLYLFCTPFGGSPSHWWSVGAHLQLLCAVSHATTFEVNAALAAG